MRLREESWENIQQPLSSPLRNEYVTGSGVDRRVAPSPCLENDRAKGKQKEKENTVIP